MVYGIMAKVPLPETAWPAADTEALPQQAGEKLVDCYLDKLKTYRKRPGLEEFVSLGTSDTIDGVFFWPEKDAVYAVSQGSVFKVTRDGTAIDITGTALTDNGNRVIFACDGSYLIMGNGGALIGSNGATTEALTDSDRPATSTHPVYLDTYCIANVPDDDKWQFSTTGAWDKDLAWDTLDYYNAQTRSDNIQAIFEINRRLFLIGEVTTEIWYNDGVSPFTRIDAGNLNFGAIAKYSCVSDESNIYFLDHNRRVVSFDGAQRRILSVPLDSVLHNFDLSQDARAFTMIFNGTKFYVITFLAQNVSYACDVEAGRWYQWGYYNTSTGNHDKMLGYEYTYAYEWGKHVIGGTDGKLYFISETAYTDNTNSIRTIIRTAPIMYNSYNVKQSRELEFRVKRGQGPYDTENTFELRWNTNNKGWGQYRQLSLGTTNDKEMFVRLSPMGTYKTRQYEIVHSANTDFQLMSIEETVKITGEEDR